MNKKLFLLGTPSEVGGANVEAGHTALLWRRAGFDVTIVPIVQCRCKAHIPGFARDNPWYETLRDAGCKIVPSGSRFLAEVPGLRGAVVSGWCNQHVLHLWDELRDLGCRLIWSPCMTYLSPPERHHFAEEPPTAVHFQSEYQRDLLGPTYFRLGCPNVRQYLIHGAMDLSQFPMRSTNRRGRCVTVGRLARAARSKWNRQLWQVLESVRKRNISLRAMCMGWNGETEGKCGPAPSWAECFAPGAVPSAEFLRSCDILLCMNGGDVENWPRVGLEAMASGVPIVADKAGGWVEMIEHGVTGMLCETPADFAAAMTRLATDDPFRHSIVQNARKAVEQLVHPDSLIPRWERIFDEIGG